VLDILSFIRYRAVLKGGVVKPIDQVSKLFYTYFF